MLVEHSPSLCVVAEEQTCLSPLHISCSRGDSKIVQQILGAVAQLCQHEGSKENLNLQDSIGRTPLFNACYHGRLDIVNQLLEFKKQFANRLDINIAENGGRTPLHAAVSAPKNSKEIVKLLLQHTELNLNVEAKPSSRAYKYLLKLAKRCHYRNSLLPNGESTENGDERMLESPIECSPLESPFTDDRDVELGILMSKQFPESPANSSRPYSMALTASSSRSLPYTATLQYRPHPISPPLSRPTSPTTPPSLGQIPIPVEIYQSPNGLLEISSKCQENQTSFSNTQVTPLAEACIFRNKDIVELLLTHGACDKRAVALQVCMLVNQPKLLYMILSRECKLQENEMEEQVQSCYHLQWSNKHLNLVRGAWLTEESSFLSFDLGIEEDSLLCHPITFNKVSHSSISKVSLDHNHLGSVPLELFMLPSVTVIDLSRNQLASLPEPPEPGQTWSCSKLAFLQLSENCLRQLPSCLWMLPSLEAVNACRNNLVSLMSFISPCRGKSGQGLSLGLKEVDLSHNKLEGVPEFLFLFPNLSKINMSSNKLMSLPDAFWRQESLQELDVSGNNLQYLPHCEMDELSNKFNIQDEETGLLSIATPLNELNVTLHEDLNRQSSIYSSKRTMSSSSNGSFRIKQVDDVNVVQQEVTVEVCDYSNLTSLNISNNNFTRFPTGLPCLAPNLVELNVSNNALQLIDVVFLPQSLKKLVARKCSIERIGNTLMESQMKAVQRKCYHSSSPVCLHRSHSSMQFLQTLDIADNRLMRLQLLQHPPLKRKTQDVTEREKKYQQNITLLNLLYPSLEGLNLSRNQLVGEFNPNIGRQTQLKWIRLSENPDLEKLPLEIAYLKSHRCTLTELQLRDLPNLREPPVEYQDRQVQVGQILTYLRSKLKK